MKKLFFILLSIIIIFILSKCSKGYVEVIDEIENNNYRYQSLFLRIKTISAPYADFRIYYFIRDKKYYYHLYYPLEYNFLQSEKNNLIIAYDTIKIYYTPIDVHIEDISNKQYQVAVFPCDKKDLLLLNNSSNTILRIKGRYAYNDYIVYGKVLPQLLEP